MVALWKWGSIPISQRLLGNSKIRDNITAIQVKSKGLQEVTIK